MTSGRTCSYILDPGNPVVYGEELESAPLPEDLLNDEGVWVCPHEAYEDEERCIFHPIVMNF